MENNGTTPMKQPLEADEQNELLNFYPFAYALYNEYLSTNCWYCLDDEHPHKRCSACGCAMFCDRECQRLAWKDHKFECRAIRRSNGNVPDIEVRLLGRIVIRHKAIIIGYDKRDADFYTDRYSERNLMDIWSHSAEIQTDPYAMKKFDDIYIKLCSFYEPKALLSRQAIFEVHCRDFINRHALSDKDYVKEIGKGLYLDLCSYDHSCRPNVIYTCKSFVATLRPLQRSAVNLADRSRTFYSYIDLFCQKQDRRKLLKDTWYFDCHCERCEDDSEHILTAIKCTDCTNVSLQIFGSASYKDPSTQLITCPGCNQTILRERVVEAISAMRFINELMEKTDLERMGVGDAIEFLEDLRARFKPLLAHQNVYYCKIIQALIPFVDPSNSKRLLELHREVEECLRICYPENHPALAVHYRNIGIFSRNVGNFTMALENLRKAYEMLLFVMGSEHSLTSTTYTALLEVEAELKREQEIPANRNALNCLPKIKITTQKPEIIEDNNSSHQVVGTRDSSISLPFPFSTYNDSNSINSDLSINKDLNLKYCHQLQPQDYHRSTAENGLETIISGENQRIFVKTEEDNIASVQEAFLAIEVPFSSLGMESIVKELSGGNSNSSATSPALSSTSSLSPSSISGDTGTGVRKKASAKKNKTPRARTPMYPPISQHGSTGMEIAKPTQSTLIPMMSSEAVENALTPNKDKDSAENSAAPERRQ